MSTWPLSSIDVFPSSSVLISPRATDPGEISTIDIIEIIIGVCASVILLSLLTTVSIIIM